MRAVLVGLAAVMLAGAAQAGECRVGSTSIVEQPNENRPGDLLTLEALGVSVSKKHTERGEFRTTLVRAGGHGKSYVLELVTGPQMLGSPTSRADTTGTSGSEKWQATFSDLPWSDGSLIFVAAGPLQGPWRIACAK